MRIAPWVSQLFINPVQKTVGNRMLKNFGFLVDFIPIEAQSIVQISFKKAMTTHNFKSSPTAFSSQSYFPIGFVKGKPLSCEPFDLFRGSRNRDSDTRSKCTNCDSFVTVFFSSPNCFEVVLRYRIFAGNSTIDRCHVNCLHSPSLQPCTQYSAPA